MPGYDWSLGGRGMGSARRGGGYEWNRPPRETMGRPFGPRDVRYGRWDSAAGYDRGVYGEAYEGYSPRYSDRGGPRGVRGRPGGYGGGYEEEFQGGFARAPFIPGHVYREHAEMNREPAPRGARWGYELDDMGMDRSDGEIMDAVRRRLYDDVWLDVDRIDVEVEDGVVTLRGEVDDFLEVRYAWDDAWETEGVRGVVTQLAVRVDVPQDGVHGDLLPQSSRGTSTEPRNPAAAD